MISQATVAMAQKDSNYEIIMLLHRVSWRCELQGQPLWMMSSRSLENILCPWQLISNMITSCDLCLIFYYNIKTSILVIVETNTFLSPLLSSLLLSIHDGKGLREWHCILIMTNLKVQPSKILTPGSLSDKRQQCSTLWFWSTNGWSQIVLATNLSTTSLSAMDMSLIKLSATAVQ